MVRMELKHIENLKTEVTHMPSGTKLITAAPVDNMGDGSSFSPTDLTATSLASCMTITMGIVAQRSNLDLKGLTISVEKEMITQPKRRIGKLTIEFNYPHNLEEALYKKLERSALACPVAQSLHPEVMVLTTFNWNGIVRKYQGDELVG